MITISLVGLGTFFMKFALLMIIMILSAVFILWPINDNLVSIQQKVIYAMLNIFVALIIFDVVQFTK